MFYRMYLSSVCNRRQWPDPHYEPYHSPHGYFCKVRVNNREYSTDVPYATEELARDGAAMKAFMICRQFSHNDGMCPGQRPGQASSGSGGVVQGLPVAIGTGRRNRGSDASQYEGSSSDGDSSGGNSPKSVESGFERQMQQRVRVAQPMPRPPPTATSMTRGRGHAHAGSWCRCQRGPVRARGRCEWCHRDGGYVM